MPPFQDLVPMIHNQSEYIKHLEAEVKFCKVQYGRVYVECCNLTTFFITVLICARVVSGRAAGDETADQCGGGRK